ncbi:triose-phosphate transporter family-domain-containing protein [Cytidiella melzeri]|nr:triose-phosphate transporter family-domain-containing protein [Cytidiella melzeri]
MGYPAALESRKQRESPGITDWEPSLDEQSQTAASYKTSPRLRHLTLRDSISLRLNLCDKHASVPTSPTLPLVSPAVREHKAKPFRHRSLPSLDAFWSTTSSFIMESEFWKSQFTWLILYFTFNLLLTLSNKSVLTSFPFPYTLTALHTLCSTLGGLALRWRGFYVPKRLSGREEAALAAFSFLYGLNVAVSNVSLNLVTVPFHQVVRAVTPIFTLILSTLLLKSRFSGSKLFSLAPVIFGVIFATYGDYYFTPWGLLLTLFGTVLAALKTIFTNVLQSPPQAQLGSFHLSSEPENSSPASRKRQVYPSPPAWSFDHSVVLRTLRQLVPPRLDIHPLDLLTRMSPLAFVQCMIYAQLSGELAQLRYFGVHPTLGSNGVAVPQILHASFYDCLHAIETEVIGGVTLAHMLILLLNGFIAFGLNIVSFSANGKVGPLSMTVAANVKQVLTILCAVSMFNLTITPMNAFGICVTLFGGASYAWVEYTCQRRKVDGDTAVG